jgi:thiol-disulfide isomerase/thioredoxin
MADSSRFYRRRFLGVAAATLAAGPLGVAGWFMWLKATPDTLMTSIGQVVSASKNTGLPPSFTIGSTMSASSAIKPSELASLSSATGWINSPPLTAEGLQGKVVLVQFWTYSCINWIRTLPYVREWEQKYRNDGLVVIGVHAPEFEFEKHLTNARWGAENYGVKYPVAVDNDFTIWRAFGNQYWPALYLIDGQGKIRYHHFGEGEYEQSERMIQKLLAEVGVPDISKQLVSVDGRGVEAAADWTSVNSPETYLGSERNQNRVSAGSRLRLNQWSLHGDWAVGNEAVVLADTDGRITYRFHARDLNLVLAPGTQGKPVRFLVLIDGQPPGAAHGADVDEQGNGTIAKARMYQLIRQPGRIGDRDFEIQFLDPGVRAFVFTFG